MSSHRSLLWALSPRPFPESSSCACSAVSSSRASKSYPVKLRSTKSASPASRREMPVSKKRTSVQSKANLPSGVDSRIRKGVCRSCHSRRYVKTSDNFSIADTAGWLRAYSSGDSERPKELRNDLARLTVLKLAQGKSTYGPGPDSSLSSPEWRSSQGLMNGSSALPQNAWVLGFRIQRHVPYGKTR